MSDTPREPSGDEAEWEGLFRSLRRKIRELLDKDIDAHEFASLVNAVDTLTDIDPTYCGMSVSQDDGKSADEGDGDDDTDVDDTDGDVPVPNPTPAPSSSSQ